MQEGVNALITLAIIAALIWWAVRHAQALKGKIPSNPPVYYIQGAKHYHAAPNCPQARGRRMSKTTRRFARFKKLQPCGHCFPHR